LIPHTQNTRLALRLSLSDYPVSPRDVCTL
jgi:hypothetical protein